MTRGVSFSESREQCRIKAEIIGNYLQAWGTSRKAGARKREADIAYFDVYAGPGRDDEASRAVAVRVLTGAVQDAEMRDTLVTAFNDADEHQTHALRTEINGLKGIRKLKHRPLIVRGDSGPEILALFEQYQHLPTLFYIDPFGYKGFSLRLVNRVLRTWGCDCAMNLNYSLINMGLGNPDVREHMNALFGPKRADSLRGRLETMEPDAREAAIVEQIGLALRHMGGHFVLPFRFKNEDGTRTSHHLIFASRHFKSYEIMKTVMAGCSSSQNQSVPSFEYSPDVERQPALFEMASPLDALGDMLLAHYAGRRLVMRDIYEQHSVGTPYLKHHYKTMLARLEVEGKVTAAPPANKRRKVKGEVTLGDDVVVRFPKKK